MTAAVLSPAPSTATRVRFIQHAGCPILLLDLSGLTGAAEILAEVRTARDLVARHAPASLRTLTVVRGARYSPAVLNAILDVAGGHTPFVSAAAVVGVDGLHRMLYRAVMLFSDRAIATFDDVGAGLDWLVAQT